jgi:hypothetical protein
MGDRERRFLISGGRRNERAVKKSLAKNTK